jgi:hypothetical protein
MACALVQKRNDLLVDFVDLGAVRFDFNKRLAFFWHR